MLGLISLKPLNVRSMQFHEHIGAKPVAMGIKENSASELLWNLMSVEVGQEQ